MASHLPSKNQAVKLYRLLGRHRKYRQKYGLIVLEGFHLLHEATRAGVKINTIFYTSDFAREPANRALLEQHDQASLLHVSAQTFEKISQTDNPQGIGAIAEAPGFRQNLLPVSDGGFFIVLDALQDPGNVGTIIRTAAAAGLDGLVLLPGTVDPFNPKTLRASMGGAFYLPLFLCSDFREWLESCRKNSLQVVAADPQGTLYYHEVNYRLPSAVIIGNENRGIRSQILDGADYSAKIPLHGKIASINAAAAASVFIFEKIRQAGP